MSFLSEFISEDKELELLMDQVRESDVFKNCYLSPFEALQTTYWLKTTFYKDDRLNILTTILSLMDKGAGLYVNEFKTLTHGAIFRGMAMGSSDKDTLPICLKYYNPKSDIKELKEKMSFLGKTRIETNKLILFPKGCHEIIIEMISEEEAMSLGQIVNGPVKELMKYAENPSKYLLSQQRELKTLLKNSIKAIKEKGTNKLLEIPTSIMINKEKYKGIINEIKDFLKKNPNVTDNELLSEFIYKIGSLNLSPLHYSGPERKDLFDGKITLYRYIKPD